MATQQTFRCEWHGCGELFATPADLVNHLHVHAFTQLNGFGSPAAAAAQVSGHQPQPPAYEQQTQQTQQRLQHHHESSAGNAHVSDLGTGPAMAAPPHTAEAPSTSSLQPKSHPYPPTPFHPSETPASSLSLPSHTHAGPVSVSDPGDDSSFTDDDADADADEDDESSDVYAEPATSATDDDDDDDEWAPGAGGAGAGAGGRARSSQWRSKRGAGSAMRRRHGGSGRGTSPAIPDRDTSTPPRLDSDSPARPGAHQAAVSVAPYVPPRSGRGAASARSKAEQHRTSRPRTYPCPVQGCDKDFSRSSHLSRHVRSAHATTTSYVCPVPECRKPFGRSDTLKKHIRSHQNPLSKVSQRLNDSTVWVHSHVVQQSSPSNSPMDEDPTPSPGGSGSVDVDHNRLPKKRRQNLETVDAGASLGASRLDEHADDGMSGGKRRRKPPAHESVAPTPIAPRAQSPSCRVDEFSEATSSDMESDRDMRPMGDPSPHPDQVPMLELARAAVSASRAESQRSRRNGSESSSSLDMRMDLSSDQEAAAASRPEESHHSGSGSDVAAADPMFLNLPVKLPPIVPPGDSTADTRSPVLPPISTISPRLQPTLDPRFSQLPPPHPPHTLAPSIGLSPALSPASMAGLGLAGHDTTTSNFSSNTHPSAPSPPPPSASLLQSPPISPDPNSYMGHISYSGGFSFLQNVPPITPALLPDASPYGVPSNPASPMSFDVDGRRYGSYGFHVPLPAAAVGAAGIGEHSRMPSGMGINANGEEQRGMRITDLLFPVQGS